MASSQMGKFLQITAEPLSYFKKYFIIFQFWWAYLKSNQFPIFQNMGTTIANILIGWVELCYVKGVKMWNLLRS